MCSEELSTLVKIELLLHLLGNIPFHSLADKFWHSGRTAFAADVFLQPNRLRWGARWQFSLRVQSTLVGVAVKMQKPRQSSSIRLRHSLLGS